MQGKISRDPRLWSDCGWPCYSSTGNLYICASARLDDRKSLVAALNAPPSADDAELILRAYRRWGSETPKHLLGDYAFVILDPANSRAFCARDHIGARAFYYAQIGEHLLFADNVSKLLEAEPALDECDDQAIVTCFAYNQFAHRSRTFFSNISKLPAGHSLEFRAGEIQISAHWRPKDAPNIRYDNDDDYVAAAREILDRSTADRLANAKRTAVHFSGGIDSTAVAANVASLIRQENGIDPIGYAWHYRDPAEKDDSESHRIEAAKAALKLDVYGPNLTAANVQEMLRWDLTRDPNMATLGEEFAIQRHAQERGVDVLLSGWGGDEGLSFNGRGYYSELMLSLRWLKLTDLVGSRSPANLARGIRRGFRELRPASQSSNWRANSAQNYLNAEFASGKEPIADQVIDYSNTQKARQSLITSGQLTARLEDWSASGEAVGIDYRYPLLDRRILDFTLGLPAHVFVQDGHRRALLRQMIDPIIPDSVRYNDDKKEPYRGKHTRSVISRAITELADEIEDRAVSFKRAKYLDMDRLIADMRDTSEHGERTRVYQRIALQFLDL